MATINYSWASVGPNIAVKGMKIRGMGDSGVLQGRS